MYRQEHPRILIGKTGRMGLLSVWKERKEISPHRPKRARTGWLLVVLAGVLLAIWLLGRLA
ncbi:hypothetical protein BH20GEM1_BH20GEM1_02380 [soil metagenome]